MEVDVQAVKGGSVLTVKAHPRARREGITGVHNGALKVAVAAAPERGKANDAIIKVLAKALDVPRSRISILTGETAALKRLVVQDMEADNLKMRLAAMLKGKA